MGWWTAGAYPADASDGRGLHWRPVREDLVMVSPKQMHLGSAQITSNNRATFGTLARGFQASSTAPCAGSLANAAAEQSAQGSASWRFRLGQGCELRTLAPKTRTSPDAPVRTERVTLRQGSLTVWAHACARSCARIGFGNEVPGTFGHWGGSSPAFLYRDLLRLVYCVWHGGGCAPRFNDAKPNSEFTNIRFLNISFVRVDQTNLYSWGHHLLFFPLLIRNIAQIYFIMNDKAQRRRTNKKKCRQLRLSSGSVKINSAKRHNLVSAFHKSERQGPEHTLIGRPSRVWLSPGPWDKLLQLGNKIQTEAGQECLCLIGGVKLHIRWTCAAVNELFYLTAGVKF